jgi:hypothetical protein
MNPRDERIRNGINDALTQAGVDVRNLTIESVDGHLIVKGTLPSVEQREGLMALLKANADDVASLECDVGLRQVAPVDSVDGRGRSPITGTSSDSAHESRHQLDRT